MRNTAGFALAAVVGAFAFWAIERFTVPDVPQDARGAQNAPVQDRVVNEPSTEAPAETLRPRLVTGSGYREDRVAGRDDRTGTAAPLPSLARRPAFNRTAVDFAEPSNALRRSSRDSADGSGANRLGPSEQESHRARSAVPSQFSRRLASFEDERQLAWATFDSGDRGRGVRLLAGIYSAAKDRSTVDLRPEVERLFREELDFPKRVEYASYLKRRGAPSAFFEERLEHALRSLERLETEPQLARRVWEEFSLAYELGNSRAERLRVLGSLEPLLERLVFSGRYSPLLATHTVKSGDNLSRIAGEYGTTVGAIKRLNRLQADVIQPRMRMRLLSGEIKVHVDKSDFRLWVTIDDRLLFEREVGLGRENGTPEGEFVIKVRQKDPTWWRPGQAPIPAGDPDNVLGSRWLGFKDTEELAGFGIHGTTDAGSIGVESSAGCVRLRNEDIELLYDFIPLGARVLVRG